MINHMTKHRFPLFLSLCLATFAAAAPPSTQPASEPTTKDAHSPVHPDDKLSVTHHEMKVAGQTLKYEATVGTLAKECGAVMAVHYRALTVEDLI